jgi:DNA-binding transcriptional ArsR family regulator
MTSLLALTPRELFKALGDPNRLRLFTNLACCKEPCTITEASRSCPTDPSVASRHLGILRNAGLVECVKKGKEVLVKANVASIVATLRDLADALERCCPTSSCCGNMESSGSDSSLNNKKGRKK